MAAELDIQETRQPVPTVTLAGEIDHFNCPRAEAVVKHLLKEDTKTLRIDLTQVEYLDTAGVAMIFWTAKGLLERGGNLLLVVPPGNVRKILEMAGVANIPATQMYERLEDSDQRE